MIYKIKMSFLVLMSMVAMIAPCWSTEIYFTDGQTALHYEVDSKRSVRSCSSSSVSYVDELRDRRNPNVVINDVSEKEMAMISRDCSSQNENMVQDHSRADRSLFIYEGTKWCGIGNNAANYNDLGTMHITDSCCRTHDKCTPLMKAWQCNGDFCNHWPWTRLHCDCDDAFYDCLKAAVKTSEGTTANNMGTIFFDVLGSKCYKNGPYEKCSKKGWFFAGCKKYKTIQGLHWVKSKNF